MKRFHFLILFLMQLALLIPAAHAQLNVTPDALHIGKATTDNLNDFKFVINGYNGLHWKYKDHYFKIDLRDGIPALAGTNGWFYFATLDFSPSKPEYLPMECRYIFILSDEKAKKDIRDLSTSLGKLNTLKLQRIVTPVSSQSVTKITQDSVSGTRSSEMTLPKYLLSSQTLEENFPTLVDRDEDGNIFADYIGLIPVLIQSIKEANEAVEQQQEYINELKQRLINK